jgi:hypothetical protein
MLPTNRFRYVKKRTKLGSSCMYPTEYTWIRKPMPVTTSVHVSDN